MPTPSSVIIADVAGGTLNSSAANFNTAVNGVASGTLKLKFGSQNNTAVSYIVQNLFTQEKIDNTKHKITNK